MSYQELDSELKKLIPQVLKEVKSNTLNFNLFLAQLFYHYAQNSQDNFRQVGNFHPYTSRWNLLDLIVSKITSLSTLDAFLYHLLMAYAADKGLKISNHDVTVHLLGILNHAQNRIRTLPFAEEIKDDLSGLLTLLSQGIPHEFV